VSSFRDHYNVDDADDPILAALRKAASEVEYVDPRWLALADGTLPPEDIEVLREEASQTEDGRLLLGLFQMCSVATSGAANDGSATEGRVQV
jgi:hypothetical protein